MIDFKYAPDDDTYFLSVPELTALRLASSEILSDKSDAATSAYANATLDYLQWFLNYTEGELKGKVFTDHQLVPQLFITGKLKKSQLKEYYRTSLYVAARYIDHIRVGINAKSIMRYDHTLKSLGADLEWLIVHYEVLVKKTVPRAELSSGRRPYLSPSDILSATRELFFIEEREYISELYLRDIKPLVIFQIRQLIEVFGKNLLGYTEITDAHLMPVKKFTQIAWEFIELECKKADSRIELPFPITFVQTINKWSNNFVHTSYIFNSYVQFYAIQVLLLMFNGAGKIRTYDEKKHSKYDISDIKIYRYNSLKSDFTDYLSSRLPGINVNWLPEKQVGAYIISL